MKKLKHVQLFEQFETKKSNPIITATGDFSKLTADGTPLDWIHANTYIVTYHANPTPDMIEKAGDDDFAFDPREAVDVMRGGPSNGLPTKTEQTDLLQALYGRNGESPAVVS